MTTKPEIFFSYAWDNKNEQGESREAIVNQLYDALVAEGYTVIRDKNDVRYKDLFSDLTRRIGKGKYIVLVISDKYLKSANCMLELLEIYRRSHSDLNEMKDKIFPIVLDDARIHDLEGRIGYVAFWETRVDELNEELKKIRIEHIAPFAGDLKKYGEITSCLADLSTLLNNMNTLHPQTLSANNFTDIKNAIASEITDAVPTNEQETPAGDIKNTEGKENTGKRYTINNEGAKIGQQNIDSTVNNSGTNFNIQ
jgi:internalin A